MMPSYILRSGSYEGNIEELVKKYSLNFEDKTQNSTIEKTLALPIWEEDGLYVIQVSIPTIPIKDEKNINLLISVFGRRPKRVQEIMEDFLNKIEIEREGVSVEPVSINFPLE